MGRGIRPANSAQVKIPVHQVWMQLRPASTTETANSALAATSSQTPHYPCTAAATMMAMLTHMAPTTIDRATFCFSTISSHNA